MELHHAIKQKASELGFDDCGIAGSRTLDEQRPRFLAWLGQGFDGGLGYLSRNLDKRFDPGQLVAGARSVIVCAVSYNRGPGWNVGDCQKIPRIASYAVTRDYHLSLRERLTQLLDYLTGLLPGTRGRVFVDTAPILEKAWGVEAGLGWIGRNSLLIHPRLGSFILLGVIVTDARLEPDAPYRKEGCGSCRLCREQCPAGAIHGDCTIDATLCISRRTIENEPEREGDLHGWLFGCDACQACCPYNRQAPVTDHDWLRPLAGIAGLTDSDWLAMTDARFDALFGQTPLARCGLERIQRRLREK